MLRKILIYILLILIAGGLMTGCEAKDVETDLKRPQNNQPVHLSVYQIYANITDAEFDEYFVQPIKKKYPNIALSLVRNGTGASPDDLVAAGNVPDILFLDNNIKKFQKLDIASDLSEFVKQYNIDLNKFDPTAVAAIKTYAGNGELLALPFSLNWYGLFYNKDIFDKFGVPYPKDSMTWEEVGELAKKVTISENGVQYYGLDPRDPSYLGGGLSLPLVDPGTNNAVINNDQWKRVYQVLTSIFNIAGNLPPKDQYGKGRDLFFKDKNVAMLAYYGIGIVNTLEELNRKGETVNWDMVTSPNFKEVLGRSQAVNLHNLMISKTSKNKEQAVQVIMELLSEQVQTLAAKNARVSSLVNPELQKSFGQNLQVMKGKNMKGIFKETPAKIPQYTEYDGIASGKLNGKIKDVLYDQKDINTALREAEEEANKAIQEEVTKQK